MTQQAEPDYPYEVYTDAYYENIARTAEKGYGSVRLRLKWLDEALAPQAGDRIIDLGTGAGVVAQHLAKTGANIESLDLSDVAIQYARKRWGQYPNIRFHVGDARHCDQFPDSSFNKACLIDVIEHVHRSVMIEIFQEANRLLCDGGLLAVYTPNPRHWIERFKDHHFILKQDPSHIGLRPLEAVVEALAETGFEIHSLTRRGCMLPVIRQIEWACIKTGIFRNLAMYRISLVGKKTKTVKTGPTSAAAAGAR